MTSGQNAHRSMTWLLLVAVLGLMAGVAPARAEPQGGWTRTVSKSYIGADLAPWPGAGVCSHEDEGPGIGCVGFGRTVGDVVTLSIYDASGLPVGAVVSISDGHGAARSRKFCGTSGPIPVVPGWLTVFLRVQSGYSLTSSSTGAAVASHGRVQATFTGAR